MKKKNLVGVVVMLIVLAVLVILGTYYQNTPEGQEKEWRSGLEKMDALAQEFPGFRALLERRKSASEDDQKAQAACDESDSECREKKTDALKNANKKLVEGWVGRLEDLSKDIKKFETTLEEVRGVHDKEFESDDDAARANHFEAKDLVEKGETARDAVYGALEKGAPSETEADEMIPNWSESIQPEWKTGLDDTHSELIEFLERPEAEPREAEEAAGDQGA